MKNFGLDVKEKLVAKYLDKDVPKDLPKSTDINVLLNRVKSKKERVQKKLFFSAAASTGLIIFGILIF